MSDCRFGVSPVNYPDPDPDGVVFTSVSGFDSPKCLRFLNILLLNNYPRI